MAAEFHLDLIVSPRPSITFVTELNLYIRSADPTKSFIRNYFLAGKFIPYSNQALQYLLTQ